MSDEVCGRTLACVEWTVRAMGGSGSGWPAESAARLVVSVGGSDVAERLLTVQLVLFGDAQGDLAAVWIEDYWEEVTLPL